MGARADIEEYTARAAVQQAIPLNIAAGATSQLSTSSIVVPGQEYWSISAAGAYATVDNGSMLLVSGDLRIVLGQTVTIDAPVAGNVTPGQMHLPIFFNNDPTGLTHTVALNLSGITLMPNDSLQIFIAVKNNDASARNVTEAGLVIRYRPIRMVSEQAVAVLNRQRIDPGLDQRLRMSRG